MALSDSEAQILRAAGSDPSPVLRQQAVGVVLAQQGSDADEARELLTRGFLEHFSPSFHLVPRGDSMLAENAFTEAYDRLAEGTEGFADVTTRSLAATLLDSPSTLAPLRMILGLTYSELAVAIRLQAPESRVTGNALKNFERRPPQRRSSAAREVLADAVAATALSVMRRDVLPVPPRATAHFHSKLDKRDTLAGWESVREHTAGVPYSALLFQRYVGGVWRQVQDAYSEIKGDALLEFPLRELLDAHAVPYHQAKQGAAGASETADRYGLRPGPDFLIPDESPTLVVESKVGEDGGTVRDKASRIQNLANAAHARGFKACALIDGKGWTERPNALCDVILATQGRTYTLATIEQLLELHEIQVLM